MATIFLDMRLGFSLLAVLAALACTSAAASGVRTLVPGRTLGDVRIGTKRADVLKTWGERHGVCRDCARTTWYFNDRPFHPEGTGVVLERGRVTHLFTVWQPRGWQTADGLRLGDPAADVARTYGPLERRECDGYYALVDAGRAADTAYYVFEDELWAFGLMRPQASPCV